MKIILILALLTTLSLWGGKKNSQILTVTAVGDIMVGTDYPDPAYLPPKGGKTMLKASHKALKKGDVIFGNLEGPIVDEAPLHKRCKNPKRCYAFKTPVKYAAVIAKAGFNFMSMANNHSGDFGSTGRDATKKFLKDNGIAYSGIVGDIALKTVKGVNVGMIAFAPNWGTYSINQIKKATKLVRKLDQKADIIIVSFHGGAEGRKASHVKDGSEMFLGENRGDLKKFTHRVIDAGADLVIGHGPHVPRAMDLYKGRLIAYSLGNFCTYGRFSLRGKSGYAPLLHADLNKDGSFKGGKIVSFYQPGRGGVAFDKKGRAAQEIKKLSKIDFPKSKLQIARSGKLSIKK